ncbi:MAG: hypothetical protein RSB12_01560, partial [Peptostreptococcaceae bacterium]
MIIQYEKYINSKSSLINTIRSKIFKMFKLKYVVNRLNIDEARIEDRKFINQKLNLIKTILKLNEDLNREVESLNVLFTNEYIDDLKKDVYNYDKFKYQLDQIEKLTEKVEHLYIIKTQKSKLGKYQQQVINTLIENEIGIKNNIEKLDEYWYKIIQNELVNSWIEFLQDKYDLAYRISSHNNIYDEICKKLSNNLDKKNEAIPKEIEKSIIRNISNLDEQRKNNLQKLIKKSNRKTSNKQFINEGIENGLLRYKPIWL